MRRFTIIFFFLVIFLLWNTSIAIAQFFEAGVQKLEPPITAPDFALHKLGGGKISLKASRGKVILLNFFTPWCEVCRKEVSGIEKLAEDVKDKRVVFLPVAAKEDEKDLKEYKKEFHISSPILLDKDGSVAKAYRVFGHHETFFINREGKIVGRTFAERDWASESMRKLIQYLLAQDR